MNGRDPKAEIFDVFLCHNSEDKPVVREIAQKLSEENIKSWLDEADIRAGSFWNTAIGQQIETVKSAAVFVGQHGVGPWQNREIIALLDQFDRRGCPVIPVILASAHAKPILPWSLVSLHCVDFSATELHPVKRLIWAITGEKPRELSDVPSSDKPATMRETDKCPLLPGRDQHAAASNVRFGDPEISDARLYPPLAEPPDRENANQLEILRRRVMEYWVDGVLKHSLHSEVLISLGKRQMGEAVDAPWKYSVEVSDSTNSPPLDNRDVNAIYDATGLLLILGEPGSGKTTTLLELARTLLERARDDIKERVPVVLNLSSWKKKQPLAEWISDELSEKYRVPRKIARFWLQHDYLLPLLDGLDEVEILMQPDCVSAINAFMDELNPPGLVVCCRLNEYRWLPHRLKLNGAVCLESLSSEEVGKYLDRGGSKLAALREAVNTDPVLQELTQTPLMLSVMSLACQEAGADELARQKGDSPEERRKQIFGLYVEQMFQRKGIASLVFPKEKIIGWLSWFARKMREHSQSVFLVEGLQPSWLGSTAQRAAYGSVVALGFGLFGQFLGLFSIDGLPFGLSFLLGVWLGCWSESPLKNGVISGLIGGVSAVLIYGIVGGIAWVSGGLVVRGVSVSVGLVGALIMVLTVGLGSGLFIGPIVGLTGGLGIGSLNRIALVETMTWKWDQSWRKAISGSFVGLRLGLISGLIFMLFMTLCALIIVTGVLSEEVTGIRREEREALSKQFSEPVELIPVLIFLVLFFGVTFGLVGGLISGLISGFAGGFTGRVKVGKNLPNQGIRLSAKNSLTASLVTLLLAGLTLGLTVGMIFGLTPGLIYFGLTGLIVGLNRGGSAVIKHYVLRLTLWLNGYTPFKFVNFLDHCARLILLKKVGGGYIFIHRMLLEYFAELPPQPTKVEDSQVTKGVGGELR